MTQLGLRPHSGTPYPAAAVSWPSSVAEPPPASPGKPRLLDQVRLAARARHLSPRTEQAYVNWIRRFVLFNDKRHPLEMGETEATRFLFSLASHGPVSASTQNQALSAIPFLYTDVLRRKIGWLSEIVRARKPRRLPIVLAQEEVERILGELHGAPRLMACLLYGAGLRLMECVRLRVKDVDLARNEITVRDGKGRKDRVTLLPARIKETLAAHLQRVRRLHEGDPRRGRGHVALPGALRRKYRRAPRDWCWQWVFPAARHYFDPLTRQHRRHRLHESVLRRSVKAVVRRGYQQARHLPHAATLLRHPPPRERLRHQDDPGAPWSRRREHHDGLRPRPQPGPIGCPEPPGPGPMRDAGIRNGRAGARVPSLLAYAASPATFIGLYRERAPHRPQHILSYLKLGQRHPGALPEGKTARARARSPYCLMQRSIVRSAYWPMRNQIIYVTVLRTSNGNDHSPGGSVRETCPWHRRLDYLCVSQ